jgi:polyamine oxidase
MAKATVLSILLSAALIATTTDAKVYHTKVAILGGGVAGISASLNLTAAGVTDFLLIEARDILGGRAQNVPFANTSVELGCNWVQGLGTNPVNQLALKYKLKTAPSYSEDVVWYNEKGKYNGTKIYNQMNDYYDKLMDIGCK